MRKIVYVLTTTILLSQSVAVLASRIDYARLSAQVESKNGVEVIPELPQKSSVVMEVTVQPIVPGPGFGEAVSESAKLNGREFGMAVSEAARLGEVTPPPASAISAVPIPAAAWLFGTALLGLAGVSRRKKA